MLLSKCEGGLGPSTWKREPKPSLLCIIVSSHFFFSLLSKRRREAAASIDLFLAVYTRGIFSSGVPSSIDLLSYVVVDDDDF